MPNVAAKADISDAQPTSRQTYKLPPGIGTKPFTRMATNYDLRVVEFGERTITVEGHQDDLNAFADRLAQLRRLCR
jgi:hypothetical protein